MGNRRAIEQLPSNIRIELDKRIRNSGFGDYTSHTAWLNKQGYQLSVETVRIYGKELQNEYERLKQESHKLQLTEREWGIIVKFRTLLPEQQEQVLSLLFDTPQLAELMYYYTFANHYGRLAILEAAKKADRRTNF